ncbi:MAG: 50S ribosomal protein L9 [Pirellulales bacterium]|nr:50S ribosomal protein L9 [Pirellulales bacterium]
MVKTKKTIKRTVPHRAKRLPKGAHGGVELLLIQPVEYLGKQGDVVEVRRGYAMNYLIPQGLATIATDHHKRMVEKHRVELEAIEKARLEGLKTVAADLAKQSITIEANANDEGHLYGSVGATEVANALKRNNFHISQDQIRLEGPIKELGLYTIPIHLAQEVNAEVKVWVVPSVVEEGAGETQTS